MTKTKPVPFADFRELLEGLGYMLKRTEEGEIFHHPREGLKLYRRYRDDEAVDAVDVLRTRKWLDVRGLLQEAEFDQLLRRSNRSA